MAESIFNLDESMQFWMPGITTSFLLYLFYKKISGVDIQLSTLILMLAISGLIIGPLLRLSFSSVITELFFEDITPTVVYIKRILNILTFKLFGYKFLSESYSNLGAYILWNCFPKISGISRKNLKLVAPQEEINYVEKDLAYTNSVLFNFVIFSLYEIIFLADFIKNGCLLGIMNRQSSISLLFLFLLFLLCYRLYGSVHTWAKVYFSSTFSLYMRYSMPYVRETNWENLSNNPIALRIILETSTSALQLNEIKNKLDKDLTYLRKKFGNDLFEKVENLNELEYPHQWTHDSIEQIIDKLIALDILTKETKRGITFYRFNLKALSSR